MTEKTFVRTEEGERIERKDFEHAAYDGQKAIIESVSNDVLIGDSNTGRLLDQNYIISGFKATANGTATPGASGLITYTTSGVITVTKGRAILGLRVKGAVEYGLIVSEGPTTRTKDISSFANGTYGVYIRAEIRESVFQNRAFWNPLAATPTETSKSIGTRYAVDWGLAVASVSPGAEYAQVASLVKTGTTLAITDIRTMMFDVSSNEGDSDTISDTEWGNATDRDDDRRGNGIKGIFQAFRSIRRQLQDIIGTKWYDTIPASLTSLNTNKLNRDGSNTITGHILPDGDETRDLGDGAAKFRQMFMQFLTVADSGTVGLDLTAGQLIGTDYVRVNTDAPGTLPSSSRLYADTMIRAWGTVQTDGAGGITSQTGVGFTASISGTNLRITFDTAFSAVDAYGVSASISSTTAPTVENFVIVGSRTAGLMDLKAVNRSTGAVDMSTSTQTITFIVTGRLA